MLRHLPLHATIDLKMKPLNLQIHPFSYIIDVVEGIFGEKK